MAEEIKLAEGNYIMYKGQPLVREGDTICYGDKSKKYFLLLDIMNYKKENGVDIPNTIHIEVVESENPSVCVKNGEKSGLTEALKYGIAWLDTANHSK